jgi:hypothetical protein
MFALCLQNLLCSIVSMEQESSCTIVLLKIQRETHIEEIETSAVDVYKDVLRPCKQNRVPLISPHSVICYGVRLTNLAVAQELSCPTSVGMDVHVLSQSKLACWNSSAIGTVQALCICLFDHITT